MKTKKKKKYSHIKKAERLEIAILLNKGYGKREIARVLKRSPGTISEEIKNNSTNGTYDPVKANHKSYVKRKYSKYHGMKIAKNKQLRNYVEEKIGKKDWSPEQIAGRLKEVDVHIKYAGTKAIYKFVYSVYGRRLEKYLRYKGDKKRGRKRINLAKLKDRVFIENRTETIEKRQRYGDWEGDFIVSGKKGKGALLVLYERKIRYTIIKKIMSQKTKDVNQCIKQMTGGLMCFNSLTIDNDISFQKHKELSELLGAPVYFCHPYHSWEKGGVENANKLIRQYIPKGSNISKFGDEYIKKIESKLNNRPRKCLGYKTPQEVMLENNQFKALKDFGIINTNKKTQAVRLEGVM